MESIRGRPGPGSRHAYRIGTDQVGVQDSARGAGDGALVRAVQGGSPRWRQNVHLHPHRSTRLRFARIHSCQLRFSALLQRSTSRGSGLCWKPARHQHRPGLGRKTRSQRNACCTNGTCSARIRGEGFLARSTIARSKPPNHTVLIRTSYSSSTDRSGSLALSNATRFASANRASESTSRSRLLMMATSAGSTSISPQWTVIS